jgi:metallo-beta-lactamase class B
MSLLIPVKQNGKTYMAAQWGGTGAPRDMQDKLAYRSSIDSFEKQTQAANATVKINAHLFEDHGYDMLDAVRNLKAGEANPWIIGKDGLTAYFDGLRKYIGEAIEKKPA